MSSEALSKLPLSEGSVDVFSSSTSRPPRDEYRSPMRSPTLQSRRGATRTVSGGRLNPELYNIDPMLGSPRTARRAHTGGGGCTKVAHHERPGAVSVLLRIRRCIEGENESQTTFDVSEDKMTLSLTRKMQKISTTGTFIEKSDHVFNRIFTTEERSRDVFEAVAPQALDSLRQGKNTTLLAYGATGSGKTFTISTVSELLTEELFYDKAFAGATVDLSIIQIYLDIPYDLLSVSKAHPRGYPVEKVTRQARVVRVNDPVEACCYLRRAEEARAKAPHARNELSSRSLSITIFTITMADGQSAKLFLVDLAGSENVKRTLSSGQTKKEGMAINSSLLSLSRCIQAMGTANSYIPFRGNTLTQFLDGSFSDAATLQLLCCVSCAETSLNESRRTLDFADVAKKVKTTQHGRVALKPIVSKAKQQEALQLLEEEQRLATTALTTENLALAQEVQHLHELVNEMRVKQGEKPLEWPGEIVGEDQSSLGLGPLPLRGANGASLFNETIKELISRKGEAIISRCTNLEPQDRAIVEALVAENIQLRNALSDSQVQVDSLLLERKMHQEQINGMLDLIRDTDDEGISLMDEQNRTPRAALTDEPPSPSTTSKTTKRLDLSLSEVEKTVVTPMSVEIESPRRAVAGLTEDWSSSPEESISESIQPLPEAVLRAVFLRHEQERAQLSKKIAALEAQLESVTSKEKDFDFDRAKTLSPTNSTKDPQSPTDNDVLRHKSSKYLSVARRRSQFNYENCLVTAASQTEVYNPTVDGLQRALDAANGNYAEVLSAKHALAAASGRQRELIMRLKSDNEELKQGLKSAIQGADTALVQQAKFVAAVARKSRATAPSLSSPKNNKDSTLERTSAPQPINSKESELVDTEEGRAIAVAQEAINTLRANFNNFNQELIDDIQILISEEEMRREQLSTEAVLVQQQLLAEYYTNVASNVRHRLRLATTSPSIKPLVSYHPNTDSMSFESKKPVVAPLQLPAPMQTSRSASAFRAQPVTVCVDSPERKQHHSSGDEVLISAFLVVSVLQTVQTSEISKILASVANVKESDIDVMCRLIDGSVCFRLENAGDDDIIALDKILQMLVAKDRDFAGYEKIVTARWGRLEDLAGAVEYHPKATGGSGVSTSHSRSVKSPSIRINHNEATEVVGGNSRIQKLEAELRSLERELEETRNALAQQSLSPAYSNSPQRAPAVEVQERSSLMHFILCALSVPPSECDDARFAADLASIYDLNVENVDIIHAFVQADGNASLCVALVKCSDARERMRSIIEDCRYNPADFSAELQISEIRWGAPDDLVKPRILTGCKAYGIPTKRSSGSKFGSIAARARDTHEIVEQAKRKIEEDALSLTAVERFSFVSPPRDTALQGRANAMKIIGSITGANETRKQLAVSIEGVANELQRLRRDADSMIMCSPPCSPHRQEGVDSPPASPPPAAAIAERSELVDAQVGSSRMDSLPSSETALAHDRRIKELEKQLETYKAAMQQQDEEYAMLQAKMEADKVLKSLKDKRDCEEAENCKELDKRESGKRSVEYNVQSRPEDLERIRDLEQMLETLQARVDEMSTLSRLRKSSIAPAEAVASARGVLERLKASRTAHRDLSNEIISAADKLAVLRAASSLSRSPLRDVSVQSAHIDSKDVEVAIKDAEEKHAGAHSGTEQEMKNLEEEVETKSKALRAAEGDMEQMREELKQRLEDVSNSLPAVDGVYREGVVAAVRRTSLDTISDLGIMPFLVLETCTEFEEFALDEFLIDVTSRVKLSSEERVDTIGLFGNETVNVCLRFVEGANDDLHVTGNNKALIEDAEKNVDRFMLWEIQKIRWGNLADLRRVGGQNEPDAEVPEPQPRSVCASSEAQPAGRVHFGDLLVAVHEKVGEELVAPGSPVHRPESQLSYINCTDEARELLDRLRSSRQKKQELLRLVDSTADEVVGIMQGLRAKDMASTEVGTDEAVGAEKNGSESDNFYLDKITQLQAELAGRCGEVAQQQREMTELRCQLKELVAAPQAQPPLTDANLQTNSDELKRLAELEKLLHMMQDKLEDERCSSPQNLTDMNPPTLEAVSAAREIIKKLVDARTQQVQTLNRLDEAVGVVEKYNAKSESCLDGTAEGTDMMQADKSITLVEITDAKAAVVDESEILAGNDYNIAILHSQLKDRLNIVTCELPADEIRLSSAKRIGFLEGKLRELESEKLQLETELVGEMSVRGSLRVPGQNEDVTLPQERGSAKYKDRIMELEQQINNKDVIIKRLHNLLEICDMGSSPHLKDLLAEARTRTNTDTTSPASVAITTEQLVCSTPVAKKGLELIQRLRKARERRTELLHKLDATCDELCRVKRGIKGFGPVEDAMKSVQKSRGRRIGKELDAVADELRGIKSNIKGISQREASHKIDEPVGSRADNIAKIAVSAKKSCVSGDAGKLADELKAIREGIKGLPFGEAGTEAVEARVNRAQAYFDAARMDEAGEELYNIRNEMEACSENDKLIADAEGLLKKCKNNLLNGKIEDLINELGSIRDCVSKLKTKDGHTPCAYVDVAKRNGLADLLAKVADEVGALSRNIKGVPPDPLTASIATGGLFDEGAYIKDLNMTEGDNNSFQLSNNMRDESIVRSAQRGSTLIKLATGLEKEIKLTSEAIALDEREMLELAHQLRLLPDFDGVILDELSPEPPKSLEQFEAILCAVQGKLEDEECNSPRELSPDEQIPSVQSVAAARQLLQTLQKERETKVGLLERLNALLAELNQLKQDVKDLPESKLQEISNVEASVEEVTADICDKEKIIAALRALLRERLNVRTPLSVEEVPVSNEPPPVGLITEGPSGDTAVLLERLNELEIQNAHLSEVLRAIDVDPNTIPLSYVDLLNELRAHVNLDLVSPTSTVLTQETVISGDKAKTELALQLLGQLRDAKSKREKILNGLDETADKLLRLRKNSGLLHLEGVDDNLVGNAVEEAVGIPSFLEQRNSLENSLKSKCDEVALTEREIAELRSLLDSLAETHQNYLDMEEDEAAKVEEVSRLINLLQGSIKNDPSVNSELTECRLDAVRGQLRGFVDLCKKKRHLVRKLNDAIAELEELRSGIKAANAEGVTDSTKDIKAVDDEVKNIVEEIKIQEEKIAVVRSEMKDAVNSVDMEPEELVVFASQKPKKIDLPFISLIWTSVPTGGAAQSARLPLEQGEDEQEVSASVALIEGPVELEEAKRVSEIREKVFDDLHKLVSCSEQVMREVDATVPTVEVGTGRSPSPFPRPSSQGESMQALQAALAQLKSDNAEQRKALAEAITRKNRSCSAVSVYSRSAERVPVTVQPGKEVYSTGYWADQQSFSVEAREIGIPPFGTFTLDCGVDKLDLDSLATELAALAGVSPDKVDIMHVSGDAASGTEICFRYVKCEDADARLGGVLQGVKSLHAHGPGAPPVRAAGRWGNVPDLLKPAATLRGPGWERNERGPSRYPSTHSWLSEVADAISTAAASLQVAPPGQRLSNADIYKEAAQLRSRVLELEGKIAFTSMDDEGLGPALAKRCDEALTEAALDRERRDREQAQREILEEKLKDAKNLEADLNDRLAVQQGLSKKLATELNNQRIMARSSNANESCDGATGGSSLGRSVSRSYVSNAALKAHIDELMEKIRTLSEQNYDLMMEVGDPNYSQELYVTLSTVRSENRRLLKLMEHYGVPVVAGYDASTDIATRALKEKLGDIVGCVNIGVNTDAVSLTRNLPSNASVTDRIEALNALIIDKDRLIRSLWKKNDDLEHALTLADSNPLSKQVNIGEETSRAEMVEGNVDGEGDGAERETLQKRIRQLECELAFLSQQKSYTYGAAASEMPLLAMRVIDLEEELASIRKTQGPIANYDGVIKTKDELIAKLKEEVKVLRYEVDKATEIMINERKDHHDNAVMLRKLQLRNIEMHMFLELEKAGKAATDAPLPAPVLVAEDLLKETDETPDFDKKEVNNSVRNGKQGVEKRSSKCPLPLMKRGSSNTSIRHQQENTAPKRSSLLQHVEQAPQDQVKSANAEKPLEDTLRSVTLSSEPSVYENVLKEAVADEQGRQTTRRIASGKENKVQNETEQFEAGRESEKNRRSFNQILRNSREVLEKGVEREKLSSQLEARSRARSSAFEGEVEEKKSASAVTVEITPQTTERVSENLNKNSVSQSSSRESQEKLVKEPQELAAVVVPEPVLNLSCTAHDLQATRNVFIPDSSTIEPAPQDPEEPASQLPERSESCWSDDNPAIKGLEQAIASQNTIIEELMHAVQNHNERGLNAQKIREQNRAIEEIVGVSGDNSELTGGEEEVESPREHDLKLAVKERTDIINDLLNWL